MEKQSVETIVQALNEAKVRYLIVGGLAVVAHGYVRFTADLDLILDLEAANLKSGLAVFTKLGYKPRAPVRLEDFADASIRQRWIDEKGMLVLSLFSPQHQTTEIDLFAQVPFDFGAAYPSALRFEVGTGVQATFVDLERLISLKKQAARPQDLADIAELQTRRKEDSND